MTKRYIFILELEAQVGEKISMADEKKNRFFNELLTEVLKNNNILRDLYWLFIKKRTHENRGNALMETVSAPVEIASAPVEIASAPVEISSAPLEIVSAPVDRAEVPGQKRSTAGEKEQILNSIYNILIFSFFVLQFLQKNKYARTKKLSKIIFL